MLTSVLIFTLPALAAGYLDVLEIQGSCPGTVVLEIDASKALVATGRTVGRDTTPVGSCLLDTGFRVERLVGPLKDRDGDGVITRTLTLGAGDCDQIVVAFPQCAISSYPEGFRSPEGCATGTNAVVHGGFDAGMLVSAGGNVDVNDGDAYTGSYSAEFFGGGEYYAQAFAPPVPVSDLTSAGMAISGQGSFGLPTPITVIVTYTDYSTDFVSLLADGATWVTEDFLAELDPLKEILFLEISHNDPLSGWARVDDVHLCY